MTRSKLLQDMALFVEVAKYRSFSRAALSLEMSVSSLSRRIAALEEHIGVRLLERTTRKINLSSYGEAFYAQAIHVVEEAQKAYDEVSSDAKAPSGFLKIAVVPNTWILDKFSRLVSEYVSENSLIKIQIDLNHGATDLMSDRYDLAIMLEKPREACFIVRKVLEIENMIFASPDYLAKWGYPQSPSDLASHQVITSGQEATWSLCRDGETVSVAVSGPVASNSPTLARRLAMEGHGLFACNIDHVSSEVKTGALTQVMPAWKIEASSFYIVTTSRLLSAGVRSFIDFASSRFADFSNSNRRKSVLYKENGAIS